MIYVREAHPAEGWWMESNKNVDANLSQPKTDDERCNAAKLCQTRLDVSMPMLVDSIKDDVGTAYSGMPERLYVIDRKGRVAYKGGRGPFHFNLSEFEQSLILLLNQSETPPAGRDVRKPQPAPRKSSAPQPARAAGDGDVKRSVEKLISELGSNTRNVRVAAERKLVALGPRILPLLPPPELTPNVSVREAVRRVRIRLENTAARESVKPSRVTLKGMQPLQDVLQSVAKQTGNRIDTSKLSQEALAGTFDVSYSAATFWTVIGDLSRRSRLRFRVVPGENRIAVEPRPAKPAPQPVAVDNSGAFRVAVLSLKTRPIVGDDANELLRVRWSITAEPRLRPLFLKYGGRSLIAETAAGKRLAPFDPDASLEVAAVDGAAPISQTSDFLLPKGVAAESIRFRGQVHVVTAARSEPVEFGDLSRAKGSSKRRGGVTVTVNSVSMEPRATKEKDVAEQRVAIDVSISYDSGGPAFESHRTWIFHNRVYLETTGGKRVPPDPAFKTIVQRDGAVGVGYRFTVPKAPPAKLRFVYVAPTLLIDVPVKFDFARLSPKPR